MRQLLIFFLVFVSSQKRSQKYHCSSTLAWCHVVIGLFHRVSLHSDLPLHLAKFYSGKVTFQSVKLGLWINAGGNLHTVHYVDVRILPHLISQHFGHECAVESVIPSQRNPTDHFDVAAILAQENK